MEQPQHLKLFGKPDFSLESVESVVLSNVISLDGVGLAEPSFVNRILFVKRIVFVKKIVFVLVSFMIEILFQLECLGNNLVDLFVEPVDVLGVLVVLELCHLSLELVGVVVEQLVVTMLVVQNALHPLSFVGFVFEAQGEVNVSGGIHVVGGEASGKRVALLGDHLETRQMVVQPHLGSVHHSDVLDQHTSQLVPFMSVFDHF